MGDLIKFPRRDVEHLKDYLHRGRMPLYPKEYESFADRLARIKESLEKINKLMAELKISPKLSDKPSKEIKE